MRTVLIILEKYSHLQAVFSKRRVQAEASPQEREGTQEAAQSSTESEQAFLTVTRIAKPL